MRGLVLVISISGVLGCSGFSEVHSFDAGTGERGDALKGGAGDARSVDAFTSTLTGKIVFTSTRDGTPHIYVANANGTDIVQLTRGSESDRYPSWSPDNKQIVFTRGSTEIWVMNANGSGLTRMPYDGWWPSWHPDGTRILATQLPQSLLDFKVDGSSARVIPLDSEYPCFLGMTCPLLDPIMAKWSPDGTHIAASLQLSWGGDVSNVVQLLDANGISAGNIRAGHGEYGHSASWSPDGLNVVLWGDFEDSLNFGVGYAPVAGGPGVTVAAQAFLETPADWAPDGRSIIVPIGLASGIRLYNFNLDTKALNVQIPPGPGADYEPNWTH